jgi:NitT/TauT family transport system substrate-binding protein
MEKLMSREHRRQWNRREFLCGTGIAGAAAVFSLSADPARAEPAPETTRLRLVQIPTICQAPQYVAEEFLRGEGFTDLQYVKKRNVSMTLRHLVV